MNITIFYSWQSDLPNATNRGFIQTALEKVVKNIRNDDSIEVEPVLERDTLGIPGSPDIVRSIFSKINQAHIFIGDVSIINGRTSKSKKKSRPTPNPNVLIELGFAEKTLGDERVLLIMNTAYGEPDNLPFDLKLRRVVTYQSQEDDQERALERRKLEAKLEEAIRCVIIEIERVGNRESNQDEGILEWAINAIEEKIINPIPKYMRWLVDELESISPSFPGDCSAGEQDDILVASIDKTINSIVSFGKLCQTIAETNDNEATLSLYKNMKPILNNYCIQKGFSGWFSSARQDFFKFIGHELFVVFLSFLIKEERWNLVCELLSRGIYIDRKNDYQAGLVDIGYISTLVELLQHRKKRLQSKQISLHADMLQSRHTESKIADVVPLDQFVDADIFLFIREGYDWTPWSYFYLHRIPQFLEMAVYKKKANELFGPLRVPSIEALRSLISNRRDELRMVKPNIFFTSPLEYFDVRTIGTK